MDGKEEQPPSVESPKGVEANGLSAMDAISRETVDLVLLLLLTYCSPPHSSVIDHFSNPNGTTD
jgi:hypothetical protein